MPKISVILPVYNGEKYLAESIDSILTQTFRDFELIVVNDGSRDGSEAIIRKFMVTDDRVRIISRENRGLIASLNEAIDSSTGEFIARMDADDVSCPERFRLQIDLLERQGLDICGCHWFVIGESGRYQGAMVVPVDPDLIDVALTVTVPFAHGSVMIRRSFLEANHLRYSADDHKFAEDYSLWTRMRAKGARLGNVDEFLFKYRSYPTSLSQKNFKRNRHDAKVIGKDFIEHNQARLEPVLFQKDYRELSFRDKENLVVYSFKKLLSSADVRFFRHVLRNVPLKVWAPAALKALYICFLD